MLVKPEDNNKQRFESYEQRNSFTLGPETVSIKQCPEGTNSNFIRLPIVNIVHRSVNKRIDTISTTLSVCFSRVVTGIPPEVSVDKLES